MPGSIVTGENYAPCIAACPVHTDTQKLAEYVSNGEYERAADLLLETNPFSSVCGRICHHPCEQSCRRSKIDAPVGLMRLKRFVIESTKAYRIKRRTSFDITPSQTGRVAVVGSGPSGMTAAHDLARLGLKVVVFERAQTPGGLLGNVIPRYRLPYSALMEDIDDILALGVELKTGCEIGTDSTIGDLFHKGFGAVLLSTGLSESRTLTIQGIDSSGVILALPFLRTVHSPKPPAIGNRVVVIGGGNVAVDVARSARRLGSSKVSIVCLESKQQMPAWEWEVEEAENEGVSVMHRWGPKAVYSENREVKGIELKRCTDVFDKEGRFNPSFDESSTATVPVDTIIIAVGQRGDLTCTEGSSLALDDRGRIVSDLETHAASTDGVFVCGELLTGPSSSVEAVQSGHRAARAIAHYLKHSELIRQEVQELPHVGDIPDDVAEKIRRIPPSTIELPQPSERVKSFSEIERGFTEVEALAEAKRCLACTTGALADEEKCAACLTCVRICPFGVATVEKTAVMPEEKCQACGMCAAECPAAAIALKRFGTSRMEKELREIVGKQKANRKNMPLIISFTCLFEVTSRSFMQQGLKKYKRAGIHSIMLPCVARLSVHDILFPFELGADGVVIIACKDGECLYPTAEERLLNRIRSAKAILQEVGIEGERIDFWKTEATAETSWASFWEISQRKLKKVLNIS
jgi:formate dehydrogenase beta subunit